MMLRRVSFHQTKFPPSVGYRWKEKTTTKSPKTERPKNTGMPKKRIVRTRILCKMGEESNVKRRHHEPNKVNWGI